MPWSGPAGPDFRNFLSSAAAALRAFGLTVMRALSRGPFRS